MSFGLDDHRTMITDTHQPCHARNLSTNKGCARQRGVGGPQRREALASPTWASTVASSRKPRLPHFLAPVAPTRSRVLAPSGASCYTLAVAVLPRRDMGHSNSNNLTRAGMVNCSFAIPHPSSPLSLRRRARAAAASSYENITMPSRDSQHHGAVRQTVARAYLSSLFISSSSTTCPLPGRCG